MKRLAGVNVEGYSGSIRAARGTVVIEVPYGDTKEGRKMARVRAGYWEMDGIGARGYYCESWWCRLMRRIGWA